MAQTWNKRSSLASGFGLAMGDMRIRFGQDENTQDDDKLEEITSKRTPRQDLKQNSLEWVERKT